MEYIKGKPYFCDCEKIKGYPYLRENKGCDILIIGGGVDGAIANYYLSQNYNVILVDKGRLGFGCTCCATALLEYQLDDFAKDLAGQMSEEEIVAAYQMGLQALDKIEEFIAKHGNHCHFFRRPTFLFTNNLFDVKGMEEEFEFRQKNEFSCQLFTKENNPFAFQIKAGIYCEDGGGELNPYLFTKQLIENSANQDKIFENTNISTLEKCDGGYIATTSFGEQIACRKVLLATGFNWEVIERDDLCERFVSYSLVTSPVADFSWKDNALLHDAASPYNYARLLPDGRIIFGGEDTPFKGKPISEKRAEKKYKKLAKSLFKLFPCLKDKVKIDYRFCGAFGTTPNNLGLIGQSEDDDDLFLFISCGANGIINAMKGIEIIEDILQGRENKLARMFSPKRG